MTHHPKLILTWQSSFLRSLRVKNLTYSCFAFAKDNFRQTIMVLNRLDADIIFITIDFLLGNFSVQNRSENFCQVQFFVENGSNNNKHAGRSWSIMKFGVENLVSILARWLWRCRKQHQMCDCFSIILHQNKSTEQRNWPKTPNVDDFFFCLNLAVTFSATFVVISL